MVSGGTEQSRNQRVNPSHLHDVRYQLGVLTCCLDVQHTLGVWLPPNIPTRLLHHSPWLLLDLESEGQDHSAISLWGQTHGCVRDSELIIR